MTPTPDTPTLALEVQNLETHVHGMDGLVRAVDGISFALRDGETYALVGESGCGKTMTALSIMGLLPRPAARIAGGHIRFEGHDLARLPPVAMRAIRGNRISMIFQEPMTALNPVFTIGDQIAEVLQLHRRCGRREARDRGAALLEEVGIDQPRTRLESYPHQMSGGMRQRVMIAMALACRPRVLIADEPTTALDVTIQSQILDLIRRLKHEVGAAVLLITHDMAVVYENADRVGVMLEGKLVEANTRAALFASPQHPYTRRLLEAVPSLLDPPRPTPPLPPDARPALRTDGLPMRFAIRGGPRRRRECITAVDGVALTLMPGHTLALVGESGCGKTTVGKCLVRLYDPVAGSIAIDTTDIARLSRRRLAPFRRHIQMIFQDPFSSLNPRMRVQTLIEEGMRRHGIGRDAADRRARVAALLEQVGLPPRAAARYPHEFSGGQRQRIGIARALAVEPRVLICDEATSSLDVSVQARILDLLDELQRRLQLAYLFISHDLSVVRRIADRVAVMRQGVIVEEGPTADVIDRPSHPYTQALIAAVPRMGRGA